MSAPEQTLAVMFADIAGSTRLYEQLGDAKALATIDRCLALVKDASLGHGGRVVKTIGDEAMVVFPTADAALITAGEIQLRMNDLAHQGNLRVAFRIGVHCGAAIESQGDVFGDSVNVAARMVALAKSGQVILTASTAEGLSPELLGKLREVDVMSVKGKEKDISIMELLWIDDAELTTLTTRPKMRVSRLQLLHGTREIDLGPGATTLTIGRDAQNDVVIADRLASRQHARIERRRDKFVVIDQSSNGTFVTVEGEPEVQLRREEMFLRESGHISFGHAYEADPVETLVFNFIAGDV